MIVRINAILIFSFALGMRNIHTNVALFSSTNNKSIPLHSSSSSSGLPSEVITAQICKKFSQNEMNELNQIENANESSSSTLFCGKYAHIRSQLDYNYHSFYDPQRQLLQDEIILRLMNATTIRHYSEADIHDSTTFSNMRITTSDACNSSTTKTSRGTTYCSSPSSKPWIVFTAGAMGAGKTHTIRILAEHQYFPLEAFVTVDPVSLNLSFI